MIPVWRLAKSKVDFDSDNGLLKIWYQTDQGQFYVEFRDGGEGSLAGDVIRFGRDIPEYNRSLLINGNLVVRDIPRPDYFDRYADWEGDEEDVSEELALLPIIKVDQSQHFVKVPKYKGEISTLLRCRGSSHVVHLLGKSEDDKLVFNRCTPCFEYIAGRNRTKTLIKSWMLQLVDGVAFLHSQGIIHRDLKGLNILFDEAGRVVICDLECHWADLMYLADECKGYKNFTAASDVYALGGCLWYFCYANTPLISVIQFIVPPPFNTVLEACHCKCPEDRPSIAELHHMLEVLEV
ncbi:unnamed protein product [Somion occarium]|uniref:Protein kinase domain-containing protein n=1 Tax=Somion occarium TaxID=3059160 RepID=A0ABP1DSY8_9APHY